MRHPDDHHRDPIDARLRDALEPAPGTVERLVQRALSPEPEKAGGTPAVPGRSTGAAGAPAGPHVPRDRRRPAGTPRRLVPAAALAASLLALAALALLRPERPPAMPAPAATITITNVGDVVVATSPAGPHWLIRSEPGATAPPGSVLILRRHEP